MRDVVEAPIVVGVCMPRQYLAEIDDFYEILFDKADSEADNTEVVRLLEKLTVNKQFYD
jgi:hypothetical protein